MDRDLTAFLVQLSIALHKSAAYPPRHPLAVGAVDGAPVARAVETMIEGGALAELLALLASAPEDEATAAMIWQRVATPDMLRDVLATGESDPAQAEPLVRRLGTQAADPLLDMLAESELPAHGAGCSAGLARSAPRSAARSWRDSTRPTGTCSATCWCCSAGCGPGRRSSPPAPSSATPMRWCGGRRSRWRSASPSFATRPSRAGWAKRTSKTCA